MKLITFLTLVLMTSITTANSNQWEGQPFAKFNLLDQQGNQRSNDDFLEKWLVVYFYPKDKTPGCTVEAQNFVNDHAAYQSRNVEIIGVSYDDVASHKDFADTYEMKFTLLADTEHTLSKAMKVNRFLPWPHASRQTFLVNPKGTIVKHYEEVDPGTHSKNLLADLKKFQSK